MSLPSDNSCAAPLERAIGLLTTIAFLLTTLFREYLLVEVFRVPPSPTGDFFLKAAPTYFEADLILKAVPVTIILCGMIDRTFRRSLIRRLECVSVGKIVKTVAVVVCVTWLLNAAGVWPFSWRSFKDSGVPIAYMSLVGGHTGALALWGITLVVITPFLEETIFRNWLLRAVASWTGSGTCAVIVTSFLFALGHLGGGRLNHDRLVHAAWLFVASCLLASITMRRAGCYAIPLTAHATYNALYFVTLLYAATHVSP